MSERAERIIVALVLVAALGLAIIQGVLALP